MLGTPAHHSEAVEVLRFMVALAKHAKSAGPTNLVLRAIGFHADHHTRRAEKLPVATLVEETGMCDKTVRSKIEDLERMGAIRTSRGGKGRGGVMDFDILVEPVPTTELPASWLT